MEKATNIVEFPKKDAWEIEWNRCKHWIAKALEHQDSYTINDVEDKIRHGLFHLWTGKRSAMVTEFVIFPQNKAMNLLLCGGDYTELEEMLPSLEAFARAAECKRLYGGGRKGTLYRAIGCWI